MERRDRCVRIPRVVFDELEALRSRREEQDGARPPASHVAASAIRAQWRRERGGEVEVGE